MRLNQLVVVGDSQASGCRQSWRRSFTSAMLVAILIYMQRSGSHFIPAFASASSPITPGLRRVRLAPR